MIGTIRKHSTALWLVVIVATVLSFVVWGTRTGNQGSGSGGNVSLGTIEGQTISRDDYAAAQREVYLRYFFNNGTWPDAADARRTGFDVERETYFRIMLVRKAAALEVHVGEDAVALMASQVMRSLNRGQPVPLDAFEAQVLRPKGLTPADFQRFVRNDLGIQQLINLAGLSGRLVTPQEVREIYERENEERSVQAVFFSLSNHLNAVAATPELIAQFYTNQLANYRIPERVQVSYVKFGLSNYLAQAEQELAVNTNLVQQIESTYERLGTNYFSDAKTPEEAKAKIRELMIKDRQVTAARKEANALLTQVYNLEPRKAENLSTLAASKGLAVQVSEPFTSGEPPESLKVDATFTREAFKLSSDEPFAGPIAGEDGFYLIAANKTLPSEVPSLDQIRERVTSDFKLISAITMARQEGMEFAARLTNALAAGRSFTSVCAEARLKPVLPAPIAPGTTNSPEVEAHVNLLLFKRAVFGTAIGAASPFVNSQDGGFIVYVQSKLPLDEAVVQAQLPRFTESIRNAMQNEAFQNWFRKEAETGLRDVPYFRQPAAMSGAARK